MSISTTGGLTPQQMQIVQIGEIEVIKPAGEHYVYGLVKHDLGYFPIYSAWAKWNFTALGGGKQWAYDLPFVQASGGTSDVGKQNFRMNVIANAKYLAFYIITDPLPVDTYYYDREISADFTYHLYSRPVSTGP